VSLLTGLLCHTRGNTPKELEQDLLDSFKINVISNIHLFNLFTPLVLKGNFKKVITISTGMADLDFVTEFEISQFAPYAISKAAMNLAVAKFSAQYSKDGVLFMSISPGLVDTGHYNPKSKHALFNVRLILFANGLLATVEQEKRTAALGAKFSKYAPHFMGPSSPKSSVTDMLFVINQASIENGHAGSLVSHFGNRQWL
jgi:NAD(P)-dependent dehydrogenase (short-subunit alcohol dehydrogenase family)